MGNDNDRPQAEQRDVPGGSEAAPEAHRSWITVAGAAVAGALATDIYNDVKAAGKAVADKIRKPPPPSAGSDSPGPA